MASANNPKINTNDNPSYTNMKYSLMSNNSNNSNVHTTAHFGGQYQN